MDALEFLRSRNRFEEVLPSGLSVTLRHPRIRDCILAGGIPLPVLDHIVRESAKGSQADVSNEDALHMARFQDELVRRSIVQIEGQDVEMTPEAVAELDQDDYDRVVAIASRTEVPKAEASTSAT